jgi:hypothetical protein
VKIRTPPFFKIAAVIASVVMLARVLSPKPKFHLSDVRVAAPSSHHQGVSMSTVQTESTEPKIVFGAKEIAPHIGKTEKAAFHALKSGKIPGAKKIGGTWALNLSVFHRAFEAA